MIKPPLKHQNEPKLLESVYFFITILFWLLPSPRHVFNGLMRRFGSSLSNTHIISAIDRLYNIFCSAAKLWNCPNIFSRGLEQNETLFAECKEITLLYSLLLISFLKTIYRPKRKTCLTLPKQRRVLNP